MYHRVGPCPGRITCNGAVEGFPGGLFVFADWRVRVLWSSGLVDRPSNRLHIRTIPLSVCMYRSSCYSVHNWSKTVVLVEQIGTGL